MTDYSEKLIQDVLSLCKKKTVIKPKIKSARLSEDIDLLAPKPFESKWAQDIFNDSEPGIQEFLNEVKKR